MHTIRFLIAAAVGGCITFLLSSAAFVLVHLGLGELAKHTPDWWGRAILFWCNEIIMGKAFIMEPKKPAKPNADFTLIICNHPLHEDIPSLLGVVARCGYRASIVSKVENLEGATGFFVGRNLQRTGRGIFISQKGGRMSREELRKAIPNTSAILIFPDKHRPTPQALMRDQKRFPNSGLTKLCVPRAGGAWSILEAALSTGRKVQVLNVTWCTTADTVAVTCEDVTRSFIVPHILHSVLKPETDVRAILLALWQEKEKFIGKYS